RVVEDERAVALPPVVPHPGVAFHQQGVDAESAEPGGNGESGLAGSHDHHLRVRVAVGLVGLAPLGPRFPPRALPMSDTVGPPVPKSASHRSAIVRARVGTRVSVTATSPFPAAPAAAEEPYAPRSKADGVNAAERAIASCRSRKWPGESENSSGRPRTL